ncbi:MAG TPA: hypothetical protein VKZ43_09335, partial [Trueperaceae bacterium]|nr:hypothetical protein [Trueperaceae bacterium]
MTQAFHGDLRFLPGVRSGEQKHPDVDKRSADPLNQLGRRLDAICTRAVDPLQIAAALESEGITDAYAAKHFGLANVFELADLLFVNVPLRVVGIEARGTAKRSPVRELSHGLLFALPALFYPALVSVVGPAWAAAALALAVVGGWGWSQLVIRVAYLMSGTGSPSGSVVWLRLSTLAGIALVAASGWLITWLLAGPSSLIALASGQMAYHMAAAILIHYQR